MRRWGLVVVVGAAVVCVAALVFVRAKSTPAASHWAVHDVLVRDFAISAPSRIAAGDVVFRVHNEGPDDHELIVVHAASELPRRGDHVTVDEDALESATVGALEPGDPGGTRDLRVRLSPGRYELFCNMAGHFLGGMHAIVTVV